MNIRDIEELLRQFSWGSVVFDKKTNDSMKALYATYYGAANVGGVAVTDSNQALMDEIRNLCRDAGNRTSRKWGMPSEDPVDLHDVQQAAERFMQSPAFTSAQVEAIAAGTKLLNAIIEELELPLDFYADNLQRLMNDVVDAACQLRDRADARQAPR